MHENQQALLRVIQERGLKNLPSLRKLAELAGKDISAQQVKHHLEQLEKKGLISINKKSKKISLTTNVDSRHSKSDFVTLPVYGTVNCGPALSLTQGGPESFIKISKSLIKSKNIEDLFIVKASGDSMNRALVGNKIIEDGDYLIIDSSRAKLVRGIGEIVLCVIDGAANIKKIFKKKEHILLVSESTKDYPPIFIDSAADFLVNGAVVSVLKMS